MNRRSFITSMLAACAAPMALQGAGRTWSKVESLLVPKHSMLNPEWVKAPFEVKFIWSPEPLVLNLEAQVVKRSGGSPFEPLHAKFIQDPYPLRYRDAGLTQFIPPFIEV